MADQENVTDDEVEPYEPDFTLLMRIPNQSASDRLDQITSRSAARSYRSSTE